MSDLSRLMIGAMSGTSADGVDVAIARIHGSGLSMCPQLVHHHHHPYAVALRARLFALRDAGQVALAEMAGVQRAITLAYAEAVEKALLEARVGAGEVAAIAAHGQTVYHNPPDTMQWLDPALLAARTNCAVVSDFRRADCAAGGQGAPLVPFADYLLVRDAKRDRVVLNIGGIANLTWVPAGGSIEQMMALDTGPGNCISDWVCRERGPRDMPFDVNGQGALQGRVLETVVGDFLEDGYFGRKPPKSTDGPEMIRAYQKALGTAERDFNDLLATAAYITAKCIAQAMEDAGLNGRRAQWVVSGGGIHNRAIMNWLGRLTGGEIVTSDELGVGSASKEALAFALLGAATLDGVASNVPSCTGASKSVVLGSITPVP